MYFWTYGLKKTWLDKCLKSRVSEDLWASNMVNWPKHCLNLNDSTFTIFIYNCERNPVGASLSELYAKSTDCFLSHWLRITSILFLIEAIYNNIFILKIFKKKMTPRADVFLNLRNPKNVVR